MALEFSHLRSLESKDLKELCLSIIIMFEKLEKNLAQFGQ